MQSYLLPEKYYDNYSEILGVDIETLKNVTELCDKPNLNKENLILDIADLNNIQENNLLNLSKPNKNNTI
jgi:hypothetical protein